MQLTNPTVGRAPILPVLALGLVALANFLNRCADGFCYTYGWPWVAFYGWSDGGILVNGRLEPVGPQGLMLLQATGDFAVGALLLGMALVMQAWWRRRAANSALHRT